MDTRDSGKGAIELASLERDCVIFSPAEPMTPDGVPVPVAEAEHG